MSPARRSFPDAGTLADKYSAVSGSASNKMWSKLYGHVAASDSPSPNPDGTNYASTDVWGEKWGDLPPYKANGLRCYTVKESSKSEILSSPTGSRGAIPCYLGPPCECERSDSDDGPSVEHPDY